MQNVGNSASGKSAFVAVGFSEADCQTATLGCEDERGTGYPRLEPAHSGL